MKKTVSQVKKTTSLITGTFDSAAGLLHHEMRTNDLVTHTFRQITCTNDHITGTNGCITGFIYFYTTGFI